MLEFLCLFSAEKGFFRKPSFGMFQYIKDNYFPNLKTNDINVYIGDAAGRPKSNQKKKDFADTDYKFALNCKMSFMTPEEYFIQDKQNIPEVTNLITPNHIITQEEEDRRHTIIKEWVENIPSILFC